MKEKTQFEEMMDRLPPNIRDTEVLRYQSKKVLAALLELYLHSKAKETKLVIVGNKLLRKISGVKSNELMSSLYQLEDYGLVTRKVGKQREGGEESKASEYVIHFKNLKKTLKEKTFDELFADELEDAESSETSMGTPTTTTITTATTTSTLTSTKTSTSTATSRCSDKISKDVEGGNKGSWLDCCFLDPRDYEEDNSFLKDLNKRVAYAKWDSEEEND
jgi:hypothetical protein